METTLAVLGQRRRSPTAAIETDCFEAFSLFVCVEVRS
jgi:hypothetical protein